MNCKAMKNIWLFLPVIVSAQCIQCAQNTAQPSPSSITSAAPVPVTPPEPPELPPVPDPIFKNDTYIVIKNLDDNTRHNISLAAKSINGLVLKPGEVFSFNKVVGERTTERGYQKATSLYGGLPIKTPGGGVCAVATAMYQAAMSTGLSVTKRVPHTRPRTYAEYGMDAAVNWPDKDLEFSNSTSQNIVLDFNTSGDRQAYTMHVSFVTEKKLPAYTSKWFTVSPVPFDKIEKTSVKINQPVIKRKGEKGMYGYRLWDTPKPTKVKSYYHPISQIKIIPE